MKDNKQYIAIQISLVVVTLFGGIAFFAWTIRPNSQLIRLHKSYQAAIFAHDPKLVTENSSIFSPYTSVQPMLRYIFLEFMVSAYNAGEKSVSLDLIPFGIEKLEETLPDTKPYLESYLYLGYANDVLAMSSTDPVKKSAYFTEAEKYYKAGLAMFPNHQTLVKRYGLSLFNNDKEQEAIDLYRKAIKIDTNVPELHYFLGQFLIYHDDKQMDEAFEELETALNHNLNQNIQLTQEAYKKLFAHYYNKKDIPNLMVLLRRLAQLDPQQSAKYAEIANYIVESGEVPDLDFNW